MNEYTDFSNVIAASARFGDAGFPAVAQVEAYWQALAGGDVPARARIDPRGIQDALEYAMILERIAPGIARIRLAGMHLNDLVGSDPRGMPFTVLFAPSARAGIMALTEEVCATGAPVEIELAAEPGPGRPALRARLLMAPLRDEFGEIGQILCCLQSIGRIGSAPRRFTVAEVLKRGAGALPDGHHRPGPPAAEHPHPPLRLVADNG